MAKVHVQCISSDKNYFLLLLCLPKLLLYSTRLKPLCSKLQKKMV